MKYKTGDIVFFKGNAIYSKFIKLYNFSKYRETGYTHVGMITKVIKDSVLIHEALSKGFTKSYYSKKGLDDLIKSNKVKISKTKLKLKFVYSNAEKYIGRPYAWFDIIGIFISFIFKFKFLKITGANKLICSEAIARILYDSSDKKINISQEYNKPYDLISPQEVYMSKYLK